MPDPPFRWTDDLARLDDLCGQGLVRRTGRRRIQRGHWQEPAPGVVCRTTGSLTAMQWLIAATLYAGEGSAISHRSAGALWGLCPAPSRVHVTVPHGRNVRSTPRVQVHQSRRPFDVRLVEAVLVTPPARTVMDIAQSLPSLDAVNALLGRAVQTRKVTVEALADELDLAPSRGSLHPRRAMADLAAGSRAASEARLLRLLRTSGLPMPELNADVRTPLGTFAVDALWRHLGKGVEIDGRAFHFDAEAWAADLTRQNAIQTAGVVLLRIPARRLWTDPAGVLADIRAFLGC